MSDASRRTAKTCSGTPLGSRILGYNLLLISTMIGLRLLFTIFRKEPLIWDYRRQ